MKTSVPGFLLVVAILASGCGSSDATDNAAGGAAGAGGTSLGGGAGSGATNAGGGGTTGTGGAGGAAGISAAGGGGLDGAAGVDTGSGGTGGADGAAGGSAAAGAPAIDGAAGGSGGTDGSKPVSHTCTNPSHVLPMNPANPQDGITLSGFYVDTDTWNAAKYQVSQTMYVCDYNNWYVVANMNNNTGDGAVKTYPNVHQDFTGAPKISSFKTISSSFAHTAPHVGIYEYAYDIWLNGIAGAGSTEVMIWTDNYNQVPSGSSLDTVTFDGASYNVYKAGSYIAFVETTNVTSGTVNLLSFFNYIIAKGWIPSTSTVGAIDYGVELVSTNGADATFQVNDFSLTTN
jgi:hypothetical protein